MERLSFGLWAARQFDGVALGDARLSKDSSGWH
jgi:hypothetical protein